ncbi:MAG TPA: PHP domain-containing protein [Syntrophorhabdaceae bacterium]|nr:PHP domain-containing protein [Syntrophorhabdaceae bacterium]
MRVFSCDLHIHSTLSPCGSLDMSPRNIVEKAREVGLHVIAITDHNMTENSFYAQKLGKMQGLTVLCGMELQTLEEIHLLAIFDTYEVAFDFQKKVYDLLPDVENDVDFYGDQIVVDTENEIVRSEPRLLINSAQISIDTAANLIKSMGGLAIPSHIDSATFSIISQIGFVPENIPFDALEVRNPEGARGLLPLVMRKNIPLVSFSDAHYVADIGRKSITLTMDEPTCREIAGALKTLGAQRNE